MPDDFPAKVTRVIYLFMAGGPSELEMLEYKPRLQEFDGKPIPDSLVAGKRFAFMDAFAKEPLKVLGPKREFKRYGGRGARRARPLPQESPTPRGAPVGFRIPPGSLHHARRH